MALKLLRFALMATVAAGASLSALAAPSAAEIAQLGQRLTPVGAERAANRDGSIPAWTGGQCNAPATYKPADSRGGFPYADPFAADKPLYTVTAANMSEHLDKLAPGVQAMLKRYPDSYQVIVYPTRRSACFPDWVYKNTIDRAAKPRLSADKLGVRDAHAQIPFPIPSNAYEVMWNSLLYFDAVDVYGEFTSQFFDRSGTTFVNNRHRVEMKRRYWDNTLESLPEGEPYWMLAAKQFAPAAANGTGFVKHAWMQADERDPMVWSYIPGQRRVRIAPSFKYDTVSTASGGILLFDEINGFDGKMDRFNFRLVGKREMLIPYNSYKITERPADKMSKSGRHPDPEVSRWELHRVWVVEATLKPGERHVQSKKVFYVDEDSWLVALYEGSDALGKIHHFMSFDTMQEYDRPAPRNTSSYQLYDFALGAWSWNHGWTQRPVGYFKASPYPTGHFAPEGMSGSSIR